MQRKMIYATAGLATLVLLLAGCRCGKDKAAYNPSALAQVGETVIRAEDLANQINELSPSLRRQYRNSDPLVGKLLEQRIEEELVLAVARERGYDRDPRIQQMIREQLVALVREDVLKLVSLAKISDEEAREYYQSHPEQFGRPARLRARHIVLATRAEAEAALEQARKLGSTDEGFARLANKLSTDARTRERGGDLGVITLPKGGVPSALFRVISGLKEPGALGGPVQTELGWHVVRLTDKQEAVVQPFEASKLQAQVRAMQYKRQQIFRDFLKELAGRTPIQRFTDRMNRVREQIRAP